MGQRRRPAAPGPRSVPGRAKPRLAGGTAVGEQGIDGVTTGLSRGATRRRVARAIAGGSLGAIFAKVAALPGVEAAAGRCVRLLGKCERGDKCCGGGTCSGGRCRCTGATRRCPDDVCVAEGALCFDRMELTWSDPDAALSLSFYLPDENQNGNPDDGGAYPGNPGSLTEAPWVAHQGDSSNPQRLRFAKLPDGTSTVVVFGYRASGPSGGPLADWSTTGAKLAVYRGAKLLKEFRPPAQGSADECTNWNVCRITAAGAVQPLNTIDTKPAVGRAALVATAKAIRANRARRSQERAQ